MDYEKLKEVIAKQIKENGRGEITGPVLQAVLMTMVDSLGEVYPQTYTEEQKAQARANIDALSNYDGEITKEKLSAEVQTILDDVANKQNITDESLATIAKTIVGAINEVYKGGLEDASIATSKIEDGAITEPKLDTTLKTKVNNNVKVVEQALTDAEIDISSKNLKFRDENGNFFADKASYDAVAKLSTKPQFSVFGTKCTENNFGAGCEDNVFGNKFVSNTLAAGCSSNTFGNNCTENILGSYCTGCTFGNNCYGNKIDLYCYGVLIGNYCRNNKLGGHLKYIKIDDGVSNVVLIHNAALTMQYLSNIHILSGVYGKNDEALVIHIPDEYLNSPRELIITTKRTDGGPSTPKDLVMYYADEVVDKQNKQDTTLETTSKEVVGAINELFNGGVRDKSIDVSKIADTAVTKDKLANNSVTTDKIADNSITMSKLKKAKSSFPDIAMAVYHALQITLKDYHQTGSVYLFSNGVNFTDETDIYVALERLVNALGTGITIQVKETDDDGLVTTYFGTVVGFNRLDDEISAIVRDQYNSSKDYFVVINTVNYEFTTKICLTDQLPKIASLETDVASLLGKVGMNVKVLGRAFDKDNNWVNLDEISDVGFYLLPDGEKYLGKYQNLPLAIKYGDIKFMWIDKYDTNEIRQKILTMASSGGLNNNIHFGWLYRDQYKGVWNDWNYVDFTQQIIDALGKKLDNTSTLTDTEVNNIWDNN